MSLGLYYRIICIALFLSSCSSVLTAAPTSTPTAAVATVTPTPLPASTNGFDPALDGFGFKNYGFDARILNLLPDDVARLFGPNVCIGQQLSPCMLIPAAQVWMEEINRAMHTGHCEGMAVLSQYFYYGILKTDSFGARQTTDLNLIDNPALQREIAYWWATQATYPTRAHRTIVDANGVLATLAKTLDRRAPIDRLFTIGMYERDFSRGHTVTPIGMHYLDPDHALIEIYDNNIPHEVRAIAVNVRANTWTYTAPNVDGTLVTYTGDATSKNLELTAAAPRMETQVCHFCPTNPTAVSVDELTTFFFSSSAGEGAPLPAADKPLSVYFMDELNRRVGIVMGIIVNEIPGATVTFLRGDATPWSPLGIPSVVVPLGTPGSIHATGLSDVPLNLTAFGPGAVVALQQMALSPDTESNVVLDAPHGQVAVASATNAAPNIVVGYTNGDQNVTVVAEAVPLSVGGKLALAVDPATNGVSVYGTNPAPITLRVAARTGTAPATESTASRPATDRSLATALSGIATRPADAPPVPTIDAAAATTAPTEPMPTATVIPVATDTTVPTATALPSATTVETATSAPSATASAAPTEIPTDVPTEIPSEIPTVRRPTRIPASATAQPTDTRHPPTRTATEIIPTDTPLPTDTALPTETPTVSGPTDTPDPLSTATDTPLPTMPATETRTRRPTLTRTPPAPTATFWWCDWNDWCLRRP